MKPAEQLTVLLCGRVQGVGLRTFVCNRARDLDLQGWVRYEERDLVRILAEGPRRKLERLLASVEETRRRWQIDEISASWSPAQGGNSHFWIRY